MIAANALDAVVSKASFDLSQPIAAQLGKNFAPAMRGPYVWLLDEGDEFDVTDCATQWNFAGTVTGGASNHYKVRYDGTNWIRVG